MSDWVHSIKEGKKRRNHTWSWAVTESCWFVGATIGIPVSDFWPSKAKELWVVNHEYLLNGNPLTPCIHSFIHSWLFKDGKKRLEKEGPWKWGLMAELLYTLALSYHWLCMSHNAVHCHSSCQANMFAQSAHIWRRW